MARAIYERLPDESTVYFGDTARVPYGPKSPETVRRYSLEILALAAGAAGEGGGRRLQHQHRARAGDPAGPVAGAGDRRDRARRPRRRRRVGGAARSASSAPRAPSRATPTLEPSGASAADARVEQRACPLFVPLVEEGWFEHPAAELIAREYLAPLRRRGSGTLVLGCTHYPLLQAAAAADHGTRRCG